MTKVIEAGHYYAVNGPTIASLQGWEIGKTLAAGTDAAFVLFVDDYHAEQGFLEEGDILLEYEEALTATETLFAEADYVFSEADLAIASSVKAKELLDDGLIKLKKGILSTCGVRLGSFEDVDLEEFNPTCTFLDYMLLTEKVKVGSDHLVVLPKAYERQQGQLQTVLEKLQVVGLSSYSNIFYSVDPDLAGLPKCEAVI